MIDVNELADKWTLSEERKEYGTFCELASAIDAYMESLKRKGMSKSSLNRYLTDFSLFGYEITREMWSFGEYDILMHS